MTLREDTRPETTIAVRARRLWTDPNVRGAACAFLAAFLLYEATQREGFQFHNMHLWLARSFLHGRIDMPDAPRLIDWVEFHGRKYSHQSPLPAVLLMPFAAIWGLGFNIRHAGALAGGACGAALWVLATRIGLRGWRRAAAWVFPVAGTTMWYEAKEGSTWGVAALLSILFLTCSLCEYFGKRRAFAIGMLVGLATLCRPGAILALAGFAIALRSRRALVMLAAGSAGAVLATVWWNYARGGSITDKAFDAFYRHDDYSRQKPYGPFSIRYLPFNLYSWLLLTPAFQDHAPWLRPTILGTGLPFTSPAFVSALAARRERWMWACLAVVVPAGLLYANGFAQFGMRYLLDAVPFLFALICVALRDGGAAGYLPLLAASVAVNTFGVWYTNGHPLAP